MVVQHREDSDSDLTTEEEEEEGEPNPETLDKIVAVDPDKAKSVSEVLPGQIEETPDPEYPKPEPLPEPRPGPTGRLPPIK